MTDPKDMTNCELGEWIEQANLCGDWGGPHDELTEIAARLRAIGEPTNWRVRDYGDGWIGYSLERDAREQAERTGALMQAVYAVTLPPPPKASKAK